MRAVFIGASNLALRTAQLLLRRGHEVVIVERDMARIEALNSELDCGFVHGDGSRPAILRETDPDGTDLLFTMTGNDQANIIASLVGRSLGFRRVVTRIEDPSFEHICIELGLEDTIVPSRTIGRHLADLFEGRDPLELSTMIRDDARAFAFVAREADEVEVQALQLPNSSRVICIYRDGKFLVPHGDTRLQREDEVVIITHRDYLPALIERWSAVAVPPLRGQ
ncbi:MAG TPA: TrkA family potassium uptake protein [Gammaproteobacteria bacterium]